MQQAQFPSFTLNMNPSKILQTNEIFLYIIAPVMNNLNNNANIITPLTTADIGKNVIK